MIWSKIKVVVNQQHIDNGKRRKCYTCPLALAIADATNIDNNCIEVLQTVTISTKGERPINGETPSGRNVKYYSLPNKALKFMRDFDTKKMVEPFTFTLLATSEWF